MPYNFSDYQDLMRDAGAYDDLEDWDCPTWGEAWDDGEPHSPAAYWPNEAERREYEAWLASQCDDSEPF